MLDRASAVGKQFAGLPGPAGPATTASKLRQAGCCAASPGHRQLLLGVVGIDRLERLFAKLFDEAEFLSPYGLRALSAYHRDHPYVLDVEGRPRHDRLRAGRVDHHHVRRQLQLAGPALVPAQLPGRSAALERYHRFFGDDFTLEYPTGSGRPAAAGRHRRATCGPADLDLPGRPRRPAALLRRGRAPAARPGVEGQPGVQRVLPRRQRRRARAPPTRPAGPGWSPT